MSFMDDIIDKVKSLGRVEEIQISSRQFEKEIRGLRTYIEFLNNEINTVLGQPKRQEVLRSIILKDDLYKRYLKSLNTSLLQDEKRIIFGSLSKILMNLLFHLDGIEKYIKKNPQLDKNASKNTVTLSKSIVLGFINFVERGAEMARSFIFLAHALMMEVHINGSSARYRYGITFRNDFPWMYKTLDKDLESTMILINQLYAMKSNVIEVILESNKKIGLDPTIFINDKQNTLLSSALESMPYTGVQFALFGLPNLNIFRHIGNAYMLYEHKKYKRREYEKRWLENHVAQLQYELDMLQKDSAEYKKTQEVINSYNIMINDLQKDIDDYINGD